MPDDGEDWWRLSPGGGGLGGGRRPGVREVIGGRRSRVGSSWRESRWGGRDRGGGGWGKEGVVRGEGGAKGLDGFIVFFACPAHLLFSGTSAPKQILSRAPSGPKNSLHAKFF